VEVSTLSHVTPFTLMALRFHRGMTRPFFKRDRISDFELFDRHSLHATAQIKQRLSEGYPVDFQVCSDGFALIPPVAQDLSVILRM
jgi:hypothetical protein